MNPISFPFDFSHKLIVLSAIVNGRKTLRVVLDTGMPGDGVLLFNTPKVKEIGLTIANRLIAAGESVKAIPVQIADDVVIDFPGLRLPKQSVLLVDGNPFPSQQEIDGIIGYALLSRYAVKVNFEKSQLLCWGAGKYKREEKFSEISMTFHGGFPYIPCTVGTRGGDALDINAYLDLGAASTIALNSEVHREFQFQDDAIESSISSALGGSISGRVSRIAFLKLANFELKNVIATSCSGDLKKSTDQDVVHEANIGTELLSRFQVVMDYANKRLLLSPAEKFDYPFRFSMSGFSVHKMQLGLFMIEQVIKNSPAGEAGLREKDIIVRVNGVDAKKIPLTDMNRILMEVGDPMLMIVSRDRTLMQFTVTPRTLL